MLHNLVLFWSKFCLGCGVFDICSEMMELNLYHQSVVGTCLIDVETLFLGQNAPLIWVWNVLNIKVWWLGKNRC